MTMIMGHCGHIYRENTHTHKLFKVFNKMIMIMVVCWGTVFTQHMCSRKEPFVSSHTIFAPWLSQHFKVWISHSLVNGRPEPAPAIISRESSLCGCMAWHSTKLRACALQEVMLELNNVMSYKNSCSALSAKGCHACLLGVDKVMPAMSLPELPL